MNKNPQSLVARIVFIILTSVVGTEFLTGSTPIVPPAWLSPTFPIIISLYGAGALLVREAAVIWKKGWLSILSFGAAYAIIEEGIFAKTWFADVPITYGKWLGVNWSFGIAETIVEAIFSIALPIALSRIAFPGSESERWFNNNFLTLIGSIYLLVVLLGFFVSFHEYTQPATQIPLALSMIAAFILIGFIIRPPNEEIRPKNLLESPKILAILCFFATIFILFFAPIWLTPYTPHPLPPPVSALLAITVVILVFRFLHTRLLSPRQLLAVVCGIATAMFLVSIVGPQNKLGAPLGVLMYLALLAFAWGRMRLRV